MYNIHTSQLNEKVQCEKAPGISDSIDRLYKECNILQEQLAVFRDRLAPYLKKSNAEVHTCPSDFPAGASERAQAIISISARIRDLKSLLSALAMTLTYD
jgi:hypothetical protein